MPILEILVGMIGSGKSKYARKRADDGALVVNDDAIYLMLHGGNYQLYERYLKRLYKSIETSILTGLLTTGRDVLVDRPNLQRGTRARYIALAKAFEYRPRIVQLPVDSPETHAERRCNSDARGYEYADWLKVARRDYQAYEAPDEAEGAEIVQA